MSSIINNLPMLLPVIIVEAVLAITALIDVIRHPNYKFINSKATWIIIVLFFQIIGPVTYFVFGRGERGDDK